MQASDKPKNANIVDSYIEKYVITNESDGVIKPDENVVVAMIQTPGLWRYFFEQLNQYPEVTTLDLSNSLLFNFGIEIMKVAAIEYDRTIIANDLAVKAMIENIKYNKTIKKLILRDNYITYHGALFLANNLKDNSVIEGLYLS